MTSTEIWKVQLRLKTLGYDLKVDGGMGRETIGVIAQFQKDRGIEVKWPGTLGPKTLAALEMGDKGVGVSTVSIPWFEEGKRKMGLMEKGNNKSLWDWLRSDKRSVGDPSKLPWCGDFVETCLALTLPKEVLLINPYLARNWSKWGVPCEVMKGAVVSFWRGSRGGISGHVGFVAGQSKGNIYVLGGNQGDRVSIMPLSKDRMLATRWPVSFPPPTMVAPTMSGGTISVNES